MKLLYITNGIAGSGGLERVLSVKASWLCDYYGYEVHILGINEEISKAPFFKFSPKIIRHNMKINSGKLSYFNSYIKALRKIVKEINPDVIAVCDDGLKGFFVPKILGKKMPIIYERHASVKINTGNNKVKNAAQLFQYNLMKRLSGDFDSFVVLTRGNLKEWTSKNLIVIPNPLPFEVEKKSTLTEKVVVSVGSLGYNKGTDLLLNIWKEVQNQTPDWRLKIYGRDTPDQFYEKQAQQMGLKNIFFEGSVKEIQHAYANGSVFVLPSRSEGFGMVLIEAMSCGLPVVSFDCPHGPADIITNQEDGFLIPNGDVKTFAEKLLSLMENNSLRRELGNAAVLTAAQYKPKGIVAQWNQLFNEIAL